MATYNVNWNVHTLENYGELQLDLVAAIGQVNVGDTINAVLDPNDNDLLVNRSYETQNITITLPVDKATQDSTGIGGTITINGPGPFTGSTIQRTTSGSKNQIVTLRYSPFSGWARGVTTKFSATNYSVDEGSSVVVYITSTDTSNFNLNWDIPGASDNLVANSGTVAMSGGSGNFTLQAVSDEVVEGNSTENLLLRIKNTSGVLQDVAPFAIGDNSHGDYGVSVLNAQGYPVFSTDGEIPYKNVDFITGTILADTFIDIAISGYDPTDPSWFVLVDIGTYSSTFIDYLDPIRVYHSLGNIRIRNDTNTSFYYTEDGTPITYAGTPTDVEYSIVVGKL